MTKRDDDAAQEAYLTLEAAINNGHLAPNERLIQRTLMEEYGLSRASVRTALLRLEQDGVVVRERNRGARVRSITAEEALEIFEMRVAVDGLAARHLAKRATETDIAELRQLGADMAFAYEEGDLFAFAAANARLDQRIVDLSGNKTVQQVGRILNSRVLRYQYRPLIAGPPGVSIVEHLAIIEAIAGHDPDAAEQAVSTHLGNLIARFRERVLNQTA